MQVYEIIFKFNGESAIKEFKVEATSIGAAFYKCSRAYPGCKLIKGYQHGRCGGSGVMPAWEMIYDPPSTIDIPKGPEVKAVQDEMELFPGKEVN